MTRLTRARVVVVGLGAVGGYAAEGLARSGVGNIRLIDTDTVQISNINRQVIAMTSTLDMDKVDAAAVRLRDINPDIQLEPIKAFFHRDTAAELIPMDVDFVIDAIDAVLPKIELLSFCYENKIPVISSMGAAFKPRLDNIRIVDISKTEMDPLARVIRRRLRRRGIRKGISVIFSPESGPPIMPDCETMDPSIATGTHRGRPRRILGSLCPFPAVFGMMAAHHVILSLISSLPQLSGNDKLVNSD